MRHEEIDIAVTQIDRQRPGSGPTVGSMRVSMYSLFATSGARRAWLLAGALVGCLAGAAEILHGLRVPVRLRDGVAARVHGREIASSSVQRTVRGAGCCRRGTGGAVRHPLCAGLI